MFILPISKTSRILAMKKWISAIILIPVLGYGISPYYSVYQMFDAVKSGSADDMRDYIDFPSVQSSVKQQIELGVERAIEEDPMAEMFMGMITAMSEALVEKIINPEVFAAAIQNGKIDLQSNLKTVPDTNADKDISPDSRSVSVPDWYAFFDRPDRFKIQLDELTLYMTFEKFGWRLTAVGIDDLMPRESESTEKEMIADKIDQNPDEPLSVLDVDEKQLQQYIQTAFHIEHSYGEKVSIRGDLYYLPAMTEIEVDVKWNQILDVDGNNTSGEYSDEEKQRREKYNMGEYDSTYMNGSWSGSVPVLGDADKTERVEGVFTADIPTDVDHYILTVKDIKDIHVTNNSGVNLKTLKNGRIAIDLYSSFDASEMSAQVFVKNSAGEILKMGGRSSMEPTDPVIHSKFVQPMRVVSASYRVEGTPSSVEVYIPTQSKHISMPVTAYPKPVYSSGKLNGPFRNHRYIKPVAPLTFVGVAPEQLRQLVRVEVVDVTGWDDKVTRTFKFHLPKTMDMLFSKVNYDELVVSEKGEVVESKPSKLTMNGVRVVEFNKPSKEWTSEKVPYDSVSGNIRLTYPEQIENFSLRQGEERHGVKLEGAKVSISVGHGIPDYRSWGTTRSVMAYDKLGRVLEKLETDGWSGEDQKIVFWGVPEQIDVIRIAKTSELLYTVNISENDIVKK